MNGCIGIVPHNQSSSCYRHSFVGNIVANTFSENLLIIYGETGISIQFLFDLFEFVVKGWKFVLTRRVEQRKLSKNRFDDHKVKYERKK